MSQGVKRSERLLEAVTVFATIPAFAAVWLAVMYVPYSAFTRLFGSPMELLSVLIGILLLPDAIGATFVTAFLASLLAWLTLSASL